MGTTLNTLLGTIVGTKNTRKPPSLNRVDGDY